MLALSVLLAKRAFDRDAERNWKEVALLKGTVKWFNAAAGYGMIQPDDGSQAVVVDIRAVERAGLSGLSKGQKLAFEVVFERGRNAATNLKLLEPAESEGAASRA
jgi:cold shock protein